MTTESKVMEKQAGTAVEGAARAMERRPVYLPATDIFEQEDAVVLVADMPGVPDSELEVHVENDLLTIRGRTALDQPQDLETLHQEFAECQYERSFTLSADVDRDGIQATLKNGVLRLVLPKAEQAKPRKIRVRTE